MRGKFLLAFVPLLLLGVVADGDVGPTREIVGGSGEVAVSDAFYQDLRTYAQAEGCELNDVLERFAGQEDFLDALTKSYERHPDSYFASGWVPERRDAEGYSAWVAFSEPISEEAVSWFAELSIPVELRFDAPFSRSDAQSYREEAVSLLQEAKGVVQADGSLDDQGQLSIGVQLVNEDSQLLAELESTLRSELPIAVELYESPNESASPEALSGGGQVPTCTTAFAAKHDSTSVLLSAHHCPHVQRSGVGDAPDLEFLAGHVGPHGDVRAYSTEAEVSNQIRIGSGQRDITSRALVPEGALVCNYGAGSGKVQCTTVRDQNHAFRTVSADAFGFVTVDGAVQVNADFTTDSDSGGPWFAGNAAVGVHFGSSAGQATFSNILDAEDVLGVEVLTE